MVKRNGTAELVSENLIEVARQRPTKSRSFGVLGPPVGLHLQSDSCKTTISDETLFHLALSVIVYSLLRKI